MLSRVLRIRTHAHQLHTEIRNLDCSSCSYCGSVKHCHYYALRFLLQLFMVWGTSNRPRKGMLATIFYRPLQYLLNGSTHLTEMDRDEGLQEGPRGSPPLLTCRMKTTCEPWSKLLVSLLISPIVVPNPEP